jgi:hypothetical protein
LNHQEVNFSFSSENSAFAAFRIRVNMKINIPLGIIWKLGLCSLPNQSQLENQYSTWKLNHQEVNFSFSSKNAAFTAFTLRFNLKIVSLRIKLLFLISRLGLHRFNL